MGQWLQPLKDFLYEQLRENLNIVLGKEEMVEQVQYLYVKVVEACNLPVNNITNSCDPFVELRIGNYTGRTRYRQDTTNPKWNDVFAFTKSSLQDKTLDIYVRDHAVSRSANDLIGHVAFPIGDAVGKQRRDSHLAPIPYPLQDQKGLISDASLSLSVWFGNQFDEAYLKASLSDLADISADSMSYTRPRVYPSPKLWYLRVKVFEARDLVRFDINTEPEVYVKAILGHSELRTKVSKKKGWNPSWDEELMFVAAEPFDRMLILSLEAIVGADKTKFGQCVFPLHKLDKRLMNPMPSDKWIDLERYGMGGMEKKLGRFAGRIRLMVFLDGVHHVFDEPAHFASDWRPTSPKLQPGTIGKLELGILKAEGLAPMKSINGIETTDAYCVVKYGSKWVRTSTVVGNLSPKWNEQYMWDVYDHCTVVTIAVLDNNKLNGGGKPDLIIGRVRIRLSTLPIGRTYSRAYPLLSLKPGGLKKMGQLHLAVRFTCTSWSNLLKLYLFPLLPRTQILNPLSVYQIHNLRHQAVDLVIHKLGEVNPPLDREVVEYVLDANPRVWSMRRAKANYKRVVDCLNCFSRLIENIGYIRQWKNGWLSALVYVVLLWFIWCPDWNFFLLFVSLLYIGARNCIRMPRGPLYSDAQLSLAEDVNLDELDEELDTFPSSANGEVARLRYDRLRSIGEMTSNCLGNLAVQLERVHSILSWRDPTATFLFTAWCLILAIFTFCLSFRMSLTLFVVFVFRPPLLRTSLPPIWLNFLRRLPAREDSML